MTMLNENFEFGIHMIEIPLVRLYFSKCQAMRPQGASADIYRCKNAIHRNIFPILKL